MRQGSMQDLQPARPSILADLPHQPCLLPRCMARGCKALRSHHQPSHSSLLAGMPWL